MIDSADHRGWLLASAYTTLVLFVAVAPAQVFDPGPSDPGLFTNGVFNVPPESAPSSIGDLQQLNVADGGIVGDDFQVNSGGEVNISGGSIGSFFVADSGSEVNISGGSVGNLFDVHSGSLVNISGGTVGSYIRAYSGSELNISGGTVGRGFRAVSGSHVKLMGGEFRLNGDALVGPVVTLSARDVLTGTLQDGSAFIFAASLGDVLVGVNLMDRPLPTLDLTPIIVDTPLPARPSGLRAGQTLILRDGGALGENFEAVEALLNIEGGDVGVGAGVARSVVNIRGGNVGAEFTAHPGSEVNIRGGNVGSNFRVYAGSQVNISGGAVGTLDANTGSEVNIRGGTVGGFFTAWSGSEVNISGGTVAPFFQANSGSEVNIRGGAIGSSFRAFSGSEVNLVGHEIFLNDQPIDGLAVGVPFEIIDRGVGLVLSGTLADGSSFDFELISIGPLRTQDFFATDAMLRVTLVPEPTAGGWLLLVAALVGTLRRHCWRKA